jgi:hypothetical protein
MNSPEGEVHTLDALDALDSVISGGLQGLSELLGQNDPNARLCDFAANGNYQPERVRLRGLLFWLRPRARSV